MFSLLFFYIVYTLILMWGTLNIEMNQMILLYIFIAVIPIYSAIMIINEDVRKRVCDPNEII